MGGCMCEVDAQAVVIDRASMEVCMYVCVYVCMCVCACILFVYMYVHRFVSLPPAHPPAEDAVYAHAVVIDTAIPMIIEGHETAFNGF